MAQEVFPGKHVCYAADFLCIFLPGLFHDPVASRFTVDCERGWVDLLPDALFPDKTGNFGQRVFLIPVFPGIAYPVSAAPNLVWHIPWYLFEEGDLEL
jgi:hypothetical protein